MGRTKGTGTTRYVCGLVAAVAMVVGLGGAAPAAAQDTLDLTKTVLLFYSDNCIHCHNEIAWLETIEERFPMLSFVMLEIDARNIATNKAYFAQTMQRLGSSTNGWPRTVIGNRVFIGFSPSDGVLEYAAPYRAYIGNRNQLLVAIEALAAGNVGAPMPGAPGPAVGLPRRAPGEPTTPSSSPVVVDWGATRRTASVVGVALALGLAASVPWRRRILGSAEARRYWLSALIAALFVGLFAIVISVPDGEIIRLARALPFPLFVTVLALADGFNPCAFTVLFILLSLLTRTNRRTDMVMIGGVFVLASALVYVAFIMAMVMVGSFALSALGPWVIRVIGAGVLIMGAIGIKDFALLGRGPSPSLTAKQKTAFSRRAGRVVHQLSEAATPGATLAAVGGTVVLAVVVNAVELGCTAILPAVYMTGLLSTLGTRVGPAHLAWTLYYGLVYVLPMIAIVANFVFTFRSQRLSESQGRGLKLAGGILMLALGGLMVLNPALLLLG